MNDPMNPVAIETAIREVSTRIAKGVKVCDETYRAYLEADHCLDVAFAQAFLDHRGPQYERKYAAELATQEHRHARDVADAAYRYADRTAKALEAELRALQSVGASVRAMFGVAGTEAGA
ncbi:MAG: hypothetical protein ACRD0P_06325 [Stackebrandtia sp.]